MTKINDRGEWAKGKAFRYMDGIELHDHIYVVIKEHVADENNEPEKGGWWTEFWHKCDSSNVTESRP